MRPRKRGRSYNDVRGRPLAVRLGKFRHMLKDSFLGSTQYQEYSWNVLGGKGWPARRADNLTAICEPIV
jgi:hypothetical protein